MRTNRIRSIGKIIYILSLVAILFLILIYFDIINNSSLFEMISMLLGFSFCLLIQFRIIEHYFLKEMEEMNLNQFAIIKDKIQSVVFGEINPKYIDKKNKIKYYNHINEKEDRLFSEENQQTYKSVMAHLRAQNQIEHFHRIRAIRNKWEALQFKISLIERFLNSLFKIYRDRGTIFKNFYQKNISKIDDDQFLKWNSLFNQNFDYSPKKQTNQYLVGYNQNIVQWKELNYLIQERMKMNFSKTKEISETVLKEFKMFSEEMQGRKKQKIDKLHELDDQYSQRKRKHKEVVDNIDFLKRKIDQVIKTIKKNKIKSTENVEVIFQNEYDLRTRNVQLENMEVKKTYTYDMCIKQSEILYQKCLQEEQWLQVSGLKSLNNKLLNYLNIMLEEEKRLHSKLSRHTAENKLNITEELQIKNLHDHNVEYIFTRFKQHERRFNIFKFYLAQMLNLYDQLQENFIKTQEIIDDFQQQLIHGLKTNDSIHDKINDRKFLYVIKHINNKEKQIFFESKSYIKKQYDQVCLAEEFKKNSHIKLTSFNQQYDKLKAIKNKQQHLEHEYGNISRQAMDVFAFYSKNKMESFLFQTLDALLQGQYQIYRYIEMQTETTTMTVENEQNDTEDKRQIKMNQYNDLLFKIQMKELQNNPKNIFEDKHNRKNDENQEFMKENQLRSIKIINKLLSVFFQEWSNSHFFHSEIKKEIQMALNKKRPSIVSYIHLKYLKIEEKDEDLIEAVNVQGTEIFRCLLQALINFKGKILIHLQTELLLGNKTPISIKLLVKQFRCPLKICFTPFSLGKSYGSMMEIPKINIECNVNIGNWNISQIPFITTILKTFIVIKLRKKMLWPKRFTLSVPMAFKSTMDLAIRERNLFDKELEKKKNKMN